jgi:aspartate-semialdehyde dehydrogenase
LFSDISFFIFFVGVVGQRFISLLQNHPYFRITHLGASERSANKKYSNIAQWKLITPMPEAVKELIVHTCDIQYYAGCDVIFSALDASVAGEIETNFAKAGFKVFSNAKNHRYDDSKQQQMKYLFDRIIYLILFILLLFLFIYLFIAFL